jgi:hypothetical protein
MGKIGKTITLSKGARVLLLVFSEKPVLLFMKLVVV